MNDVKLFINQMNSVNSNIKENFPNLINNITQTKKEDEYQNNNNQYMVNEQAKEEKKDKKENKDKKWKYNKQELYERKKTQKTPSSKIKNWWKSRKNQQKKLKLITEDEGKKYAEKIGAKFKLTSAKNEAANFTRFLEELFEYYIKKNSGSNLVRHRGLTIEPQKLEKRPKQKRGFC